MHKKHAHIIMRVLMVRIHMQYKPNRQHVRHMWAFGAEGDCTELSDQYLCCQWSWRTIITSEPSKVTLMWNDRELSQNLSYHSSHCQTLTHPHCSFLSLGHHVQSYNVFICFLCFPVSSFFDISMETLRFAQSHVFQLRQNFYEATPHRMPWNPLYLQ